ncbi:MAG: hypothetical protein RL641_509 [Candidatus Parcubacteria bacterium]|jgi:hypothetical protein
MKKISIICLFGGLLVSALYAYLTVGFFEAHKLLNPRLEDVEKFTFYYMFIFYLAPPFFVFVSLDKAFFAIGKRSKEEVDSYFKYIASYPTKLGRFLVKHPALAYFFAFMPVLFLIPFLFAIFLESMKYFFMEISMSVSDKWDDLKWRLFKR